MIQKFKKYLIVGVTGLSILLPGLVPAVISTAYADTSGGAGSNVASGLCSGVNSATNGTTNNTGCNTNSVDAQSTLQRVAKTIVNIFSIIVGAVAVFMIIYGGFRYITSGGDSNRVGNAKNTLIYAIIGLIIVALAQAIVHFVFNQTSTATGT